MAPRHFAPLLSLLAAMACTDLEIDNIPPVAMAGADQVLEGDSDVTVILDGSDSMDDDGEIVSYEWRFTGFPGGVDLGDEDGGVEPTLVQQLLKPLPTFCPDYDPAPRMPPIRWCLLEAPSADPKVEITVGPGAYLFTLYVTDNDDEVGADTTMVAVGQ